MTQVIVVCEGQTEERFVKEVLARSLWVEDLYLYPRLIPTSPTSKGGSLSGQRVVGFLRDLLRQRWAAQIATFFDLYGLPSDFPGARDAEGIPDPLERATAVEAALRRAAVDAAGRGERRFHPHTSPTSSRPCCSRKRSDSGRSRRNGRMRERNWPRRAIAPSVRNTSTTEKVRTRRRCCRV